jgi:hypothetical protein
MSLLRYAGLVICASLFLSCSHRSALLTGEAAYNRALDQAFYELEAKNNLAEGRELASDQSVADLAGADFSKLRGSIEVVVFPKLSNGSEKRKEALRVNIGSPITYTFNVQRNLNCKQLNKEIASQWSHQQFFADVDSDADCAILRVFQSAPQKKVANVRPGDVKELRLYVDSNYGVYGFDYDLMRSRRDSEVVRVKTDARTTPGSSGLGLFPVNLPPVNAAEARVQTERPIQVSQDAYVNRKLKELGVKLSCSHGTHAEYRDVYGIVHRTQWCRGDVWPTLVENANMIAVLKRGK